MAAQLGRDAYEKLKASDLGRTAPGKVTWQEIVGDRPTILIIDEIAAYLRQLTSSGNPDVRRQGQALPSFLKNLYELAAGSPNVVLIITLATVTDAFGKEAEELSQLLEEAETEFQSAFADAKSIRARMGAPIRPAEDHEIVEILKRRLFESIDTDAATSAASRYRAYYEEFVERSEVLGEGAEAPASYSERIEASYPFHPEIVRVLDKRIGSIGVFNRARGALGLFAEVVKGVWEEDRDVDLLNVADIDFRRPAVLSQLTMGIDRPDFGPVPRVDFAAADSHAARVDAERFAGRAPYATRACTTVFCHSLELLTTAGATRSDYLLGTLQAGDDPTYVGEALAVVEKVAWHLAWDGARWRILTEPNANAIIAEAMRNVPNSWVNAELDELLSRKFPTDGPVKTVFFPSGPGIAVRRGDVAPGGAPSRRPPRGGCVGDGRSGAGRRAAARSSAMAASTLVLGSQACKTDLTSD